MAKVQSIKVGREGVVFKVGVTKAASVVGVADRFGKLEARVVPKKLANKAFNAVKKAKGGMKLRRAGILMFTLRQ